MGDATTTSPGHRTVESASTSVRLARGQRRRRPRPVHVRPHRRRALQPHVPRQWCRWRRASCCAGRRSATSGQRPRHGSRAPDHRRPADARRAGATGARLLRRPSRQRAPRSTSWASSTVTSSATGRRRTGLDADRPERRASGRSSTRWPRSTPSTSTPRARRPRPHEGYIARQLKRWYGQWNAAEDARAASGRRGPRRPARDASPSRARPRSSTATTASTTAWSTTTATSSPCSTGRSARSATRSPTSGCCRCTGPAPATRRRRGAAPPTTRRGSGTAPSSLPGTPRCRGRDISQLDFYVAFAYWKLACILEGVYSRYLGGALGDARSCRAGAVRHAGRRRRGASAPSTSGGTAMSDPYSSHEPLPDR